VKATAKAPKGKEEPKPAKTAPAVKPAGKPAPSKSVSSTKAPTGATKEAPKAVPTPETLLKRKKHQEKLEADRYKEKIELRKKRRLSRQTSYKRAAMYEAEYKKQEAHLIRMRRIAKDGGSFFVEPEPKVALVIRIRGIMGVSPKVKKILRLFRLRQLHNAVFVKLTGPMIQMLRWVEPYITYGYPNLKTVRELVYKRGFAKIRGNRIPITDNSIIEENVGKHNLICVEDLIHEIYTCGPHFKEASKFLWPFKLNSPRGGFTKKRIHFTEGGDAGNRERYINKLVRRMN